MYDYWMIIVGGIFGAVGLWGLLTGSTTIYYRSRPGWGGHQPLFTYQGRGLALVLTIMGGLLVGLYLLAHGTVQRIAPTRVNSYAGIVFAAGLGLGILVCIVQGLGFGRAAQGRSQKKFQGVSLTDAAAFLKMPEADLLQMAQNGGIEARHANGIYEFHPDVLRSFQESMERMDLR
jgi:hypothetical protein